MINVFMYFESLQEIEIRLPLKQGLPPRAAQWSTTGKLSGVNGIREKAPLEARGAGLTQVRTEGI